MRDHHASYTGGSTQPTSTSGPTPLGAIERETEIISMTYGQVPDQQTFMRRYLRVIGRGNYEMELVGDDLYAMQDAFGDPQKWIGAGFDRGYYAFDWQNLYMVLQSLVEETENRAASTDPDISGDPDFVEAPTSLASSILSTLGFEWV